MANGMRPRSIPAFIILTLVVLGLIAVSAIYVSQRGRFNLSPAKLATATPVVVAAAAPDPQRWFFAEGVSTPPFSTSYAILNPGRETADVSVTLYAETGRRAQRMVRVAPGTQVRVPAATILPDAVFGAEIFSTQPVYVERLTLGARDGTTSPGLERALEWYFPDAQAGGDYETRLVIFNPDQAAASVTVTFLPVGGQSSQRSFEIAAATRRAILVSSYAPAGPLAMIVRSTVPIVAEHVTHYDSGQALYGSPGVMLKQLSKTWYVTLANTQTWFSARLAVFNPDDYPAIVRVTMIENKTKKTIRFDPVPPGSKRDLNVNDYSGGTRVAVEIVSDRLIAVQTVSAYISSRDGGAVAAYSMLGAPAAAKVWYLPETAGDDDYDSYLSIFNPQERNAAKVDVTYVIEDAQSVTKRYPVGSLVRITQSVRDEVKGPKELETARRVIAVIVRSDQPVVAERVTMFKHTVGATSSAGIPGR